MIGDLLCLAHASVGGPPGNGAFEPPLGAAVGQPRLWDQDFDRFAGAAAPAAAPDLRPSDQPRFERKCPAGFRQGDPTTELVRR
jgi:hypothetical protein